MAYIISKFPGPDSTIEEWRQFMKEAGTREVFDLVRTARRPAGTNDIGFHVLVECAQTMVAEAGGGTAETGLDNQVVAEVAESLGYKTDRKTNSLSNFRKLVLGIRRQRRAL